MALLFLSLYLPATSTAALLGSSSSASTSYSSGHVHQISCRPPPLYPPVLPSLASQRTVVTRIHRRTRVVCMAPEEEKMTRRSPLDFPIEWERPKPGRRPDIFPQFSPMKTPLPPPLPADPPEEDEEEEEKKEEEDEDPEQENPDQQ